jgi:hypothetical protein
VHCTKYSISNHKIQSPPYSHIPFVRIDSFYKKLNLFESLSENFQSQEEVKSNDNDRGEIKEYLNRTGI